MSRISIKTKQAENGKYQVLVNGEVGAEYKYPGIALKLVTKLTEAKQARRALFAK